MKTPAEKLAAKKRKAKPKAAWGDRRKARRPVIFPQTVLKKVREELGLTQRDVSTGSGINNATVCDAELGFEVTLSTALKLAAFFGKSIESLWPTTN